MIRKAKQDNLFNTQLDAIIPEYDFHEKHRIIINASPGKVYNAAKAVTAREIFIFRALMYIRSLPSRRMFEINPDIPLLKEIFNKRFRLLDDIADTEIVFGIIGRFWKLNLGENVAITDTDYFIKFNRPAFVKAAANMRIVSLNGRTLLTTETRVIATDDEAKRKFRLYWIIIRIGSGFMRRMWLRAIKRRAEITE